MRLSSPKAAAAVLATALAAVLAATAGASPSASAACAGKGRITAAEVTKAVAPGSVTPVYAVPRCHPKYTFAFLDIDSSIPFFAEVDSGLRAAAKFYGVTLLLTDLKNQPGNTVSQYEALSARRPQVVGTLVNSADNALFQQTQKDGLPLILLEGSFSTPPTKTYTLVAKGGDTAKGTAVGDMLGKAVADKLKGPWKGKRVVFVEAGQAGLAVVDARMDAALAAFRKHVKPGQVVKFDTLGQTEKTQTAMTDVLTSHPNDVFAIAPLNDESGVGAVNALRSQGRAKDGVVSLLGADRFGRDAMRNDRDGIIVGAVYANPFQEGWNWVEAAIAVMHKAHYSTISAKNLPIVTKANVDKLFPKG